ncbi:MAG: hypothetical protein LBN39_04560 [Planctomycetaceae bacterium]|jgi:hypothetical protein|nr:hypothetical protein [Planctomycetaceae bacterium]
MNSKRNSFIRKLVYVLVLAVLVAVLYAVGKPASTVQSGGETRLNPGGVLAQLRTKEGLTESQLGQIDPASSTIKLATFGMRGVAIALLWHQSNEYQKRKDWNNVIATSNQLVFLEPHFTTIWEFLGWNLAYNASAEFDDYRERYRWCIRGIDFLTTGVENNLKAPKLCKATGWTISQKIGIADENQQYRRLLREDEDFGQKHDCPLPSDRDNWMLGRRWYHQGEQLVKEEGISIGNESDFLFFSNSRLNLFNYAVWKRKDGIFGAEAVRAWDNAGAEWNEFAKMDLSTAIPVDGSLRMRPGVEAKRTTLETTDIVRQEKRDLLKELEGLSPNLKEKLCIDRWKKLAETKGQQGTMLEFLDRAYEKPGKFSTLPYEELQIICKYLDETDKDWKKHLAEDLETLYTPEQLVLKKIPQLLRDEDQGGIVNKAEGEVGQVRSRALEMIQVNPKVVAQEIQDIDEVNRDAKRRSRAIAEEIDGQREKTRMSDLYRDILNFEYRIREVAAERMPQADDAHRRRYEGRIAYYDGRYEDSITGWLDGMKKWEELYNMPGYDDVASEGQFIREIIDIVEKFVIILDNANKVFSDVAKDKVPMDLMMRNKLNQESNPQPAIDALEYAKKEYETALTEKDEAKRKEQLEKVEKYFTAIARRFENINGSVEFMKLAPLYDIRDKQLEANAYLINAALKLGKPLPEPLPLRTFTELMLQHDPAVDSASDAFEKGIPLLREKKFAEAQAEFDNSVALWKPLLEKYPLIAQDPTLQTNIDLQRLAAVYSETLKAQNKTLSDDSPFKPFVK